MSFTLLPVVEHLACASAIASTNRGSRPLGERSSLAGHNIGSIAHRNGAGAFGCTCSEHKGGDKGKQGLQANDSSMSTMGDKSYVPAVRLSLIGRGLKEASSIASSTLEGCCGLAKTIRKKTSCAPESEGLESGGIGP